MSFDASTDGQDDDHGRLLVSTGDGTLVRIDAGSNAFAWRLAGVVFGAILVGLIYLLAATMFGRRRIAVLAAAFVAIDGMSYVMSRISMNDIFVAVFIVAAYLVFWQVWSGRWARSAWWALPLVGVLIGLAAATKWVGFYALAGLWVLALARSDLGRLLLVALVAFAVVVGGIGAPWPFLVAMLLVLAVALAIVHVRPIRFDGEAARIALPATGVVLGGVGLAFALAYDSVGGRTPGSAVEYVFSILSRGAQAGWPGVPHARRRRDPARMARVELAARPALRRPLVGPEADGRLRLGVDRRLLPRHPAHGVRAQLRPVPRAGACLLGGAGGTGLRMVSRRAARPDVRLPLQA